MLKLQSGKPYPWRVELPRATEERRRELIQWCQENLPGGARRNRWVPPFRDTKSPRYYREWGYAISSTATDCWSFIDEQDVVLFNMVWSETI